MPTRKFLASPLKEFKIPVVSWCPNVQALKEFQDRSRLTYRSHERIEIKGREWYRFRAYSAKNDQLGEFLLPVRYYELWRRLIYGALLQEKMFEGWIQRTKHLQGRRLNAVQEKEIYLESVAGVRMVQYLLYRRMVVEELMKLRFNNDEAVVHSLIEFGIRESRDWMFETFENAKKEGAIYLRLDPTALENRKEFGEW